jgi:hypothetical protein
LRYHLHCCHIQGIIKVSDALHDWLQTTIITVHLPSGAVDTEDYNTGNIISGSWHNNGHVQGMQNITFFLESNNYSNDPAQYFGDRSL